MKATWALLCCGALLIPGAPAAFAQGSGGGSGHQTNAAGGGDMPKAGSGAKSGANGMSRGSSGNSGAGAAKMGGSNAMSGNGKR